MNHKYKIGQSVVPAISGKACPRTYRVVQLLPETSYEPQYRILSTSGEVEFIVRESEIKVV
jgi:hypothetical protein